MFALKLPAFSNSGNFAYAEIVALDLFGGEISETQPHVSDMPAPRRYAYRYAYRVLVVWLSEAGELLAQVSRPMAHRTAYKLWARCLRADSDVLDVVMFNAAEATPSIPGVRLVDALTLPPKLVRVDRDDLFEPVTVSRSEPRPDAVSTLPALQPGRLK